MFALSRCTAKNSVVLSCPCTHASAWHLHECLFRLRRPLIPARRSEFMACIQVSIIRQRKTEWEGNQWALKCLSQQYPASEVVLLRVATGPAVKTHDSSRYARAIIFKSLAMSRESCRSECYEEKLLKDFYLVFFHTSLDRSPLSHRGRD